MPALLILLAITLSVSAGGGVVYAAQDALPNDPLYSVKTTAEGVQLALTADDGARAQLHADFAAKRLAEVKKASETGRAADGVVAAESLAQEVALADDLLAQAATDGKDVSVAASRVDAVLARQQEALASVADRVPDQAKPAIAKAQQSVGRGLKLGHAQAQPTSTPTATAGTPSVTPSVTPEATGTPVLSNASSPTVVPTALAAAINDTKQLANDPNVPGESYNGLLAKLNAAQAALGRGQKEVAVNILDAFLHDLNADQRSGHIDSARYEALYKDYQEIVKSLGGTPLPQVRPNPKSSAAGEKSNGKPADQTVSATATSTPTPEPSDSGGNGHGQSSKAPGPKATPRDNK